MKQVYILKIWKLDRLCNRYYDIFISLLCLLLLLLLPLLLLLIYDRPTSYYSWSTGSWEKKFSLRTILRIFKIYACLGSFMLSDIFRSEYILNKQIHTNKIYFINNLRISYVLVFFLLLFPGSFSFCIFRYIWKYVFRNPYLSDYHSPLYIVDGPTKSHQITLVVVEITRCQK